MLVFVRKSALHILLVGATPAPLRFPPPVFEFIPLRGTIPYLYLKFILGYIISLFHSPLSGGFWFGGFPDCLLLKFPLGCWLGLGRETGHGGVFLLAVGASFITASFYLKLVVSCTFTMVGHPLPW
jgi:hypothetical protein